MKKKEAIRISFGVVIQLVFCGIVLFAFHHVSLLRPVAYPCLYKEYLCAIIVLAAMLVNEKLWFPLLYAQNKTWKYVIASLLTTLLAALGEIALVYPQSHANLLRLKVSGAELFFIDSSICVFLRDAGFVLLSFTICALRETHRLKKISETLLYKENMQIEVIDEKGQHLLVQVADIIYCQQNGNFTNVYLLDGRKYHRYGSLSQLQNMLATAGIVPISRNCFVLRHAVADFSKKDVDLRGDGGWNMQLLITDAYRESAIPLLQGKTQQEEWGQPRNEKTYKAIYDYIATHPRCSAQDIQKQTGLAPSSVYRYIRLLKEDGLIDREGSNKTGGYYAHSAV
ncbi:MAG: winged helix-turn-helix transcriptional regulator [Bacteroidales bacterium]|nr:winged helix-turn-helix transcriptional regulator [Bacteroidales bacterium]